MTTDWRTNLYDNKSDMKYFTDEIEDNIRKLYPKGQLISKCPFDFFYSSQKRKKRLTVQL